MVWRLLRDVDHAAAWNMALDQAILDAVESGIAPATLRIYGWSEPAVTVGRFQDAARDVDLSFCAAHGVPIVRRPTGGRGILHGGDVTVSIVAPNAYFGLTAPSVAAAYEHFSKAYVTAFEALGMPLERGACQRPKGRAGDCFQVRSGADLVSLDGIKQIGSAMRRTNDAILLQSSVRHCRIDIAGSEVFTGPAGREYFPLEHVEETAIHEALMAGFKNALHLDLRIGDVTGWEEQRAAALVKSVEITENSSSDGVSVAQK